ncbi:MAG TPA: type IV toxin-antitoxin system AbiEi family antitoxin, partial [Kineosporiaceae bacterium]|nr:type IV toxin-antitoxin system AbiEi family antitoxin [Kineosporiaceae bacterium]
MISDAAATALCALPGDTPFLRRDAVRSGLSERGLLELVRAGLLRQPLRGVLLCAHVPDDVISRAAAARLVLPEGSALCRRTAAWLYGVDARPPGSHREVAPTECVVAVGQSLIRRTGLHCYVTDLTDDDIVDVGGVPCTTPSRTAIDLARWSNPGMGLAVLDAMTRQGLINPEELLAQVERWHGDRFVAQARRLIILCNPLAESFGESWLRLRFHDAGFPTPELQISLADREGVEVYRLDLGYPHIRHSWEYDGEQYHLGLAARC